MKLTGLIILVTTVLLTGCVTESTGPAKPVANDRDQLGALIELGVGYIRNREYTRAKDNLLKALEVDPNSAMVHNLFGLVFQLEGEPDLADDYFKKSLRLDPGFSMARNNYGAFLYEQGRFAEAVEQLEICAGDRLYGARARAFENLGVSYVALGRTADAEAAFTRSTQLNPSQGRALLEMATIRFDQQNYVEARSYLRRYDSLIQPTARSLWLGIRLARVFGDQDGEASQVLALKNIFPASPEYKLYQESQSTP